MKILVTGNAGMIGVAVEKVLRDNGHEIVGFDIKNGQDILNQQQARDHIQGCDAVVYLAALLGHLEDSANGSRSYDFNFEMPQIKGFASPFLLEG